MMTVLVLIPAALRGFPPPPPPLLSGSLGAFCKVHQADKRMLDFYSKLGCFEVAKMEGFPKDFVIMGRSL